jgi:precorrin-2/cobalt-factor-2 C20-methyltransferase
MTAGTLYGVGVGPGDPELLTLKAVRVLRSVPVVFTPTARPGAPSLARSIAAPYLDAERQRIVELVFAMRDEHDVRSGRWHEHAAAIAAELATGDVAFITEGDPLLYSTFVHVATALAEQQPEVHIEVVPGVSSVFGAAAAAMAPLADGDERLAVVPASYEQERLRETLLAFDTVVFLKIARAFERVLDVLEELRLVDGAVYVARCGQPQQQIVRDVRSLRGQKLDYFSLLIVRRGR